MKHSLLPAFLFSLLMALPTLAQTTQPAAFSDWSPAVNGLQVRILSPQSDFFVELRNVGDKPLIIPSLQLDAAAPNFPWHIQTLRGAAWKDLTLADGWGHVNKTDPISLAPKQTALLWIANARNRDDNLRGQYRLSINQTAPGPIQNWTGELTTPPVADHDYNEYARFPKNAEPAPNYFPPLFHYSRPLINSSMDEPAFHMPYISNLVLFDQLALYKDDPICIELEKRLAGDKDFISQLLLALEAGKRGSDKSREFFLNALQDLDYEHCRNTLVALAYLNNAPWAGDALVDALKDTRKLNGKNQTVSQLAQRSYGIVYQLGMMKSDRILPLLIDLARNGENPRNAISALGLHGKPAAIPVLIEIAKTELSKPEKTRSPEIYDEAFRSLTLLNAPGIVDLLLDNLYDRQIIEMLEPYKDPRAIPVFKQIVQTGKFKDTKLDPSDLDRIRFDLILLEEKDPTQRLCDFILNQSMDWFVRCDAIRTLADLHLHLSLKTTVPQVIPTLVKAAKQDSEASVVRDCIIALGALRQPAAVDALIDLLTADFSKVQPMKTDNVVRDLRNQIAQSLTTLTRQSFGTDANAWKQWWSNQDPSKFK